MSQLSENSILLMLTLSKPENRRSVRLSEVQIRAASSYDDDPDPEMLSLSKAVLAAPEYDQIVKQDRATGQWLRRHSLPFAALKSGVYLIPTTSIIEVNSQLDEFKTLRQDTLIPTFLDVYETRAAEARSRLGALAHIEEYPAKEDVAAAFNWQQQYLALEVPRQMSRISAQLFQTEMERHQRYWENASEQIVTNLHTQLNSVVEQWIKKLNNPSPQQFQAGAVDKLAEFLNNLKSLNQPLANEPLEQLISRAQSVVQGVTVDTLKDNKGEREKMLARFDELKQTLAALVSASPSRKLRFDMLKEGPGTSAPTAPLASS